MGALEALKSVGLEVKVNEDIQNEFNKVKKDIPKKPLIEVKSSAADIAVHKGIIPYAYKDVYFDVDHIKDNIINQVRATKRRFKVKNFDGYIEVLNGIIASIKAGVRPNRSYLIGAPNGFGKTSFVMTCLKLMVQQEWKVVPYVSLLELAEIRLENEKKLSKGLDLFAKKAVESDEIIYYSKPSETFKEPETIVGRFSWSEYMNADILFCFFTEVESKMIESYTLKQVLSIRAAKGLPTIAFISTSLDPYKMDFNLREYVWDEILAYKEDVNCFDRVYHISTYKVPNTIIGDDDIGINI